MKNTINTKETSLTGQIRERLAISAEAMGRVLQVTSRTIARWEEQTHNHKNPGLVLRIHKLKEIVDLGSRIYTPEGLRLFLSKPQPAFAGHTAYQLMSIGEYDAVISALAADYEGMGF